MAHSYRLKIGLREIAAMQPHTILWDLAVRGFHCRRQYGDAVTFAVFYPYNEHAKGPSFDWALRGLHP